METIFTFKVIVTLTFDQVTSKTIEAFYSTRAINLWILKTDTNDTCCFEETVFTFKVTVTLTSGQLTPKTIGIFSSIRAIFKQCLKAVGQIILHILCRNLFSHSRSLWPSPLTNWPQKIKRILLLNKANHWMMFEGFGSNSTSIIEWKWSVTYGQGKTKCLLLFAKGIIVEHIFVSNL